MADEFIRVPQLDKLGVAHGFGVRGSSVPPGTLRPNQVHGVAVARVDAEGRSSPETADAIVCRAPGPPVAVVTADCVPVLAASQDGSVVAAIHAGWRGLAAGVVEAGIEALRDSASEGCGITAAVGPYIGACCYEVDAPVLEALAQRYGPEAVSEASQVTRPGHAQLDLGALVTLAIRSAGAVGSARSRLSDTCTSCNEARFHSFRRDGDASGRLIHWIQPSDQLLERAGRP